MIVTIDPDRFKQQVRQRVAEGHPAAVYATAARRHLGAEAEAFLASLPPVPARVTAPRGNTTPPARPPFYGRALKALLAEFGVTSWQGCGCEAKVRAMDSWTADEVRASRETVAGWLKAASVKAAVTGHWSALFAGGKMARQEWFRKAEPFLSVVDEAIRRAEANP